MVLLFSSTAQLFMIQNVVLYAETSLLEQISNKIIIHIRGNLFRQKVHLVKLIVCHLGLNSSVMLVPVSTQAKQ